MTPAAAVRPDEDAVATSGATGPSGVTRWAEPTIDEQFSGGDDDVLKAVYDRYGRLVYTYCARRLRDDAAADATQEVFLAAWKSRATYDATKAPLGAWLLGITRYKVVDALRRQGRQPLAFADGGPIEAASTAPAADDELAARLLVVDSLAELGERPRRVMTLTFLEGHTNQEVAERLQLPVGTVKSDIRRGLQRLRERMGEFDGPA